MRILVFGNPLVPRDSIALQALPFLQERFPDIEFVEFDAVESLEKEGPEPIILDCVQGIPHCEIITDLARLERASRQVSMHDFDLRETLFLLHKMGLIKKTQIIAIPVQYGLEPAVQEVTELIQELLEQEKN
ncbi:hypothetical protein KKE06_05465 [Candidatus Micrarchaeota archaeon]|nr:hypothetical protein [Candidatus Micrarchaeota archaeon]MBU1930650.1 hypothetical protein [Candidatus Micrarchaeota archaeon]